MMEVEVTDDMVAPGEIFPCKLRLCVICVSEVVLADDVNDKGRNVLLEEERDADDAMCPEVYLKGLAILCDKLGMDGIYGNGEFWNVPGVENFVKFVCCMKCYNLLKGLVTLQELILATQRTLGENIQEIESCVIESAKSGTDAEFSFNSCFQFRSDVLSNYEQRSNPKETLSPPVRRKVPSKKQKPGPARSKRSKLSNVPVSDHGKLGSCFVKLEKVEDEAISANIENDRYHYELEDDEEMIESEAILGLDVDYDDDGDVGFAEQDLEAFSPVSVRKIRKDDDDDEDFKPRIRGRHGDGKPRKRGRPKKKLSKEEKERLLIKRKRGRPAKLKPPDELVIKRPRGRPAKPRPLDELVIKRPRGRPKRNSEVLVEVEDAIFGVDMTSAPHVLDTNIYEDAPTSPHLQSGANSDCQESVEEYQPVLQTTGRKSRARNSGRPAGRPKKEIFPITIDQAKQLITDVSYIKPVLVVDEENGRYSYHNVRIQRENTVLSCKHPGCDFFLDDMAYFSDQVAFRTMKLHIKHYHRLRNYRIYTNSDNEKSTGPTGHRCVYSCCHCDEDFLLNNNLLDHVRNVHKDAVPRKSLCEVCGTSMEQQSLLRHLYKHKNEEEKKVARESKTKRVHPGRKKDTTIPLHFPCDQCDKVFKNHTELRIHKNSHIPIEFRKQFQCDECGERMSTHNILRGHKLRVHNKSSVEYPFVCHICNKKYMKNQRHKYDVHMRLHTGETPYQCTHCGKRFHCKYSLKLHERTHVDTKIPCEFCTNFYKSQKYLLRHHRKHHRDKVELPNRAATDKYVNAEHRPEFIGPKMAHPCEPCGRIYQYKSQLIAHMKHGHKLFLPKSEDYPEQNTYEMQHERDLQRANPEPVRPNKYLSHNDYGLYQ